MTPYCSLNLWRATIDTGMQAHTNRSGRHLTLESRQAAERALRSHHQGCPAHLSVKDAITFMWDATLQLVDEVIKLRGETEKDRLITQQLFFEEKTVCDAQSCFFQCGHVGEA